MGKRELVALLNLSSWCLVMVERLSLLMFYQFMLYSTVNISFHDTICTKRVIKPTMSSNHSNQAFLQNNCLELAVKTTFNAI